jgi:hypothetical protein
MIIEFDKSFEKTLDKIKDNSLFPKIENVIIKIEKANSLTNLVNVKSSKVLKVITGLELVSTG